MQLHPSDPDIQTIVARIRSRDLDLQPDFQRGEVWSNGKKRRLIDSILRNWHVPPIHVVVDKTGLQTVLDGQQRLASIRDFVNGEITVDGKIEPYDSAIASLDGLRYSDLPDDTRRAFDQFTIRVFRLTDYSAEEPGELFFRLNQMTYLTAAEQRNAFFGPVRAQIKELVRQLELNDWGRLIGFSNRRMAYDDVLAKLLCTLEANTLIKKITANDISDRFRASNPFQDRYVALAGQSIDLLNEVLSRKPDNIRLNKATLFSWLMFFSTFARKTTNEPIEADRVAILSDFFHRFEQQRIAAAETSVSFRASPLSKSLSPEAELSLIRVYVDRSSSRVLDVTSIVLRDVILWVLFAGFSSDRHYKQLLPSKKVHLLQTYVHVLEVEHPQNVGIALERMLDVSGWGSLQ